VTLADRNLINADHLRTRPARSRKLGLHVLLVEVPVQPQIRRYVIDCRGSTAANPLKLKPVGSNLLFEEKLPLRRGPGESAWMQLPSKI
jgi:hypothetical protein